MYVDLHLTHEVTSPQAFAHTAHPWACGVRRPDRRCCDARPCRCRRTLARSSAACRSASNPRRGRSASSSGIAREFGFELLGLRDARRGIVHVIGPELGLTQPGMTIVCGDSHTSTHGAFGTLAFGIGTTEVGARVRDAVPAAAQAEDARDQRSTGRLAPASARRTSCSRSSARIGVAGGTRPRDRVPRQRDPRTVDGRAHDRLQHVDRGGRARRHDRAGRDDIRVPARAAARAGGSGIRARGGALAGRRRRCGRGFRWRDCGGCSVGRADDQLRHEPRDGDTDQRDDSGERGWERSPGAALHGTRARRALAGRAVQVVFIGSCTNRGCRICAPRPRCCEGGESPRGCACSSCRARSR